MAKLKKASELVLAAEVKQAVQQFLTPFEDWTAAANPEAYIEDNLGKYIKGLEMMLAKAVGLENIPLARALTLDLIKLSKMGRAKADVNINMSQLRDENDFKQVDTDQLRALLGKKDGLE